MRTVDLFAGCGGLSLGFIQEGFEVVAAFEWWDAAVKCYEKNFDHPVFKMDLSDTDAATAAVKDLKPELIIGGPPCQDFSHAGKRIEANRASLTDSFAIIVANVSPKYFVMENVDRARNSKAYASARTIFKEAGYGLTEMVLDASLCGSPQKRKRFICFGALNKEDGFAEKQFLAGQSDKPMTVRDYFGDSLGFEYYYRHPRNYSRRGIFSIDEPAPTMRGVNRPVPKGYPGHPNDACPVSESLHALTTAERALIQTFPKDFVWEGSKTDVEQMIGERSSSQFGKVCGKGCQRNRGGREMINTEQFKEWMKDNTSYSDAVIGDNVSRMKRADSILEWSGDETYLFYLEKEKTFLELTVSVRSQLRKAVKLYSAYSEALSKAEKNG